MRSVVSNYNDRIKWWNKNTELIDLDKPLIVSVSNPAQGTSLSAVGGVIKNAVNGPAAGSNTDFLNNNTKGLLSEVVVTAMGIRRESKQLGYSVARISNDDLNRAKVTDLATGLASKVSGLQINLVNNGVQASTRIILRGNRSILGNNQPLVVVDDIPVPVNFMRTINPNDVENITVLKGASASALYGSDASNGVIIISTKKGTRNTGYSAWKRYSLNDVADMDYMQEIKNANVKELWDTYSSLEKEYGNNASFYFDMADYFFEMGQQQKAMEILFDAAEQCSGNSAGLKAVAYTLESWKNFDEAIKIYKELLAEKKGDLATRRDLALAYYQQGKFQQAVDMYYSIITFQSDDYYGYPDIKQMAMNELNAVIALHFDSLNLSGINVRLVKTLPVDLRITTENNFTSYWNDRVKIEEPQGETCSYNNPETKWGGHFTRCSDDYYYTDKNEYSIKNATKGNYRIVTDAYAYNYYNEKIPHFIRVIAFKNFQRPNQTMEVKNIILDNQYGEVEIADIKW